MLGHQYIIFAPIAQFVEAILTCLMCLVRKHSIIDSIHVLLLNCGVYLQWKQNINTDFEYIIFIIVLLTVLFRLNAFITEINLRHLVQNYRTDIFLILISF